MAVGILSGPSSQVTRNQGKQQWLSHYQLWGPTAGTYKCQRPDADTCIVVPEQLARLGLTVEVAAVEVLAVSVLSCACTFYPRLCTVQWRPMVEI